MKFISWTALLASLGALGILTAVSCSKPDATALLPGDAITESSAAEHGSLRLSLSASDQQVRAATAVLSGGQDFPPQTHDIDVSDPNGVASIFFGDLKAGRYSIQLVAGDCTGVSTFDIRPGEITQVSLVLTCPAEIAADAGTGSALITPTLPDAGAPNGACDHILRFVATPSVQDGASASTVSLVLRDGVTPTTVTWTSASADGASGSIGDQEGDADTEVSFDCTADGTAYVIANVTAPSASGACTEQGRVAVACLKQGTPPGPRCGDGVLNQASEECDGSAFATDAGGTCSSTCTLVPPAAPSCGDGVVNQDTEECDGSALRADAGAPSPGTICSSTCTLIVPTPPICGDGKINQDTEQCDGSALPPGAATGSSCRSDCTLALPITLGACGKCSADNCAELRAALDASPEATGIVQCVIGTDWQNGERADAASCGNLDLLTCYCGEDVPATTCSTRDPATLTGACVKQILAGTSCDSSACVASVFLNKANATGTAMQYVQCQQNFCYDDCFNP